MNELSSDEVSTTSEGIFGKVWSDSSTGSEGVFGIFYCEERYNIDAALYLQTARSNAEAAGYDPSRLLMSTNDSHKLQYIRPDGIHVRFGSSRQGDYIIYKNHEDNGLKEPGYADKEREKYVAKVMERAGKWMGDKYSSNYLSLKIIWATLIELKIIAVTSPVTGSYHS